VWWLEVVGILAFATILGTGFCEWRRSEPRGDGRYVAGLFGLGLVLLAVGIFAVVAGAL
jgi:hypothetical protein